MTTNNENSTSNGEERDPKMNADQGVKTNSLSAVAIARGEKKAGSNPMGSGL